MVEVWVGDGFCEVGGLHPSFTVWTFLLSSPMGPDLKLAKRTPTKA